MLPIRAHISVLTLQNFHQNPVNRANTSELFDFIIQNCSHYVHTTEWETQDREETHLSTTLNDTDTNSATAAAVAIDVA